MDILVYLNFKVLSMRRYVAENKNEYLINRTQFNPFQAVTGLYFLLFSRQKQSDSYLMLALKRKKFEAPHDSAKISPFSAIKETNVFS